VKPGRVIVGALLAVGVAWGAASAWRARRAGATPARSAAAAPAGDVAPPPDDSTARAPIGERVRVQVLNATKTRGLARRATLYLRDRGFDVVEVGTAAPLDSTVVYDRSGRADWARRVARAMGGAHVEPRPDSSRYLDVTVLVGRSWGPPPQPLYP
jgi:hypothetical protein